MDGWMDVWVDRWMDGWDETGGAFSFLNRHFLTTLKTKFKHKTADFSGGPVVKSPSANAGTQLPSLVFCTAWYPHPRDCPVGVSSFTGKDVGL